MTVPGVWKATVPGVDLICFCGPWRDLGAAASEGLTVPGVDLLTYWKATVPGVDLICFCGSWGDLGAAASGGMIWVNGTGGARC